MSVTGVDNYVNVVSQINQDVPVQAQLDNYWTQACPVKKEPADNLCSSFVFELKQGRDENKCKDKLDKLLQ